MLDLLLASTLLFGLPIRALLRSYSTGKAPVDKCKRYRKSTAIIVILLIILFVDWVSGSRGFTQLGLAAPTTHPAIAGCLVAVSVPIILFLALITKSTAQKAAKPDDLADTILPESRDELRYFVIFTVAAGFGWEVLYRGFLLFWLSPIIGLVPAVVTSSIAYALSHGCKTLTQTAGSLVSALLFTTGYAVTGSLWWLIILHIALPSLSVLAVSRMERTVVSDPSGQMGRAPETRS
jgi:membrane protease YdiL (CAAX protease family)